MSQSPVMSPNDLSSLLQIKESTLRKYSILLENVGYTFQRNNQNQRWYNDTDIVAFKKLISLKNSTDMTLKDCAEAVFLWSKGHDITQPLTVVDDDTKRHSDDITELKAMVNQQNILLQELVKKIDQQQKYIDEKLEQRDKTLLESIRGTQEIKQQLLEIASAREEKKSFFSRLFGK
jgi:DNA-binding transcriptional MerR regulator